MSFEPVMPPYNSSDPSATFLSSSCLDFLLIELVPLAYRVTEECDSSSAGPNTPAAAGVAAVNDAASVSLSPSPSTSAVAAAVGGGVSQGPRKMEDEEALDAVHYRLDMLGYRVGQGLVERYSDYSFFLLLQCQILYLPPAPLLAGDLEQSSFRFTNALPPPPTNRFSRDRPRFNDTLDVIKFLCKDLWSLVFGKNIDNLKTNHRVCNWDKVHGAIDLISDLTHLLAGRLCFNGQRLPALFTHEHSSRRPGRCSSAASTLTFQFTQRCKLTFCLQFLWFPCGIVRGALAALGINATVQAEVHDLPGAVFQIKSIPIKS